MPAQAGIYHCVIILNPRLRKNDKKLARAHPEMANWHSLPNNNIANALTACL